MGSSITSVASCISKALFQHCRGAATSAPFALNRLHVRCCSLPSSSAGATSCLSYMETVGKDVESAAKWTETMGGVAKSREEMAYDAAKGKAEKVKDTVIAEANENVVDTSEYRSMEEMGSVKTCSF